MRSFALAVQNAALLSRRTRRATRKPVPPARPPSAARVAYLRELLAIQRILEALVRRDVLPLLPSILGQHNATRPDDAATRLDATGKDVDDAFERVKEELGRAIPERHIQLLAQESALRVSEHSRKELERQIHTVAKIDLFEGSQGLAEHIDAFIGENVQLVKSLTAGQLDELKATVLRGARQGLRSEVVAREIEERFGVSRRRATLIATDQIAKLNGELAQLRQQQVGIKRYTWSTSQDERVRKSHRALNGTRHEWTKPPLVDGVRAHPGQPVRCRCQAIPDVDDVLREAGLLGDQGESLPPPPGPAKPEPSKAAPAPKPATPRQRQRAMGEAWAEREKDGGKAVRTETRSLLHESLGLAKRTWEAQDKLTVTSALPPEVAGQFAWGEVKILTSEARVIDKAMAKVAEGSPLGKDEIAAVKVLVHEEIHGHGPLTKGAYARAPGQLVEEVATEAVARISTRELLGLKGDLDQGHPLSFPITGQRLRGAYDAWIQALAQDIAHVTQWTPQQAMDALKAASLEFKRSSGQIDDPLVLARKWVQGVPKLTTDQQTRLMDRLLATAARLIPRKRR
jgi:SPP1 gp7 family putative phage head morphogenesis protein